MAVIEVDGYAFHKEGTKQAERDELKNHILEKLNIPLLRLKTNGSDEKTRIISKLDEVLNTDYFFEREKEIYNGHSCRKSSHKS